MYQADSMFLIGRDHIICQDYAITSGSAMVIVCDGCSSAPNVDIGARLLAHTALSLVSNHLLVPKDITWQSVQEFGTATIVEATRILRQLGCVDERALSATLSLAFIHMGEWHVIMFGDGSWLKVDDAEGLEMVSVNYSGNAPPYLTYQTMQNLAISPDFGIATITTVNSAGRDVRDINTDILHFRGPAATLKLLAITSDGVDSFIALDQGEKPTGQQVMEQIAAIKQPQGEFMKRRLRRITSEHAKNRIFHYDDLSVGAIVRTSHA